MSASAHHHALPAAEASDRVPYILAACRGKSVLHLGCVDHPFLAERLTSRSLLHAQIHEVAGVLWGVDLDGAGLEQLRRAGFSDLHEGNVEQPLELGQTFDVVVASEILEHLANPGAFLQCVPEYMKPDGTLLITVPSAHSIRLMLNTTRRREVVHPDHRAYYSATTLSTLLRDHDFVIEDIRPYWTEPRRGSLFFSIYDRLVRATRVMSPWFGEGIAVRARFRGARRKDR